MGQILVMAAGATSRADQDSLNDSTLKESIAPANEDTQTPYVEWEHVVIVENRAFDGVPRMKTVKDESLLAGGGWNIEFHGRTCEGDLLLASYEPSDDQGAREWLRSFESGTLPAIPLRFHAYIGPPSYRHADTDDTDHDRVDVETDVFIGGGWARWHEDDLTVTIPPEVFGEAAASLLSDLSSDHAHIGRRIFQIFTLIDPTSFSQFLSALGTLSISPPIDETPLINHPRAPTYSRVPLMPEEVIAVFRNQDGVISHQQLYLELRTTSRALKGWLKKAGLVQAGEKKMTGCLFTTRQLLDHFVPWLKDNAPTYATKIFIRHLIEAKVIQ